MAGSSSTGKLHPVAAPKSKRLFFIFVTPTYLELKLTLVFLLVQGCGNHVEQASRLPL